MHMGVVVYKKIWLHIWDIHTVVDDKAKGLGKRALTFVRKPQMGRAQWVAERAIAI
jgi:hypothetical protein